MTTPTQPGRDDGNPVAVFVCTVLGLLLVVGVTVVILFGEGCGGTVYSLHPQDKPPERHHVTNADCASIATWRTVWTVVDTISGALGTGAGTAEAGLASTDTIGRWVVTGIVVGSGIATALATAAAVSQGTRFAEHCAEAETNETTSNGAPSPAPDDTPPRTSGAP